MIIVNKIFEETLTDESKETLRSLKLKLVKAIKNTYGQICDLINDKNKLIVIVFDKTFYVPETPIDEKLINVIKNIQETYKLSS